MILVVVWTVVLLLLPTVRGSSMHAHDPFEIDVQSESCDYDSIEGFAGDVGTNFYTVEYYYSIQVDSSLLDDTEVLYFEPTNLEDLPENSLQNVVLEVELAIASYLLHDSVVFESAPCNNGRRRRFLNNKNNNKAPSSNGRRRTIGDHRRLNNVGMTIGPDDEFLAMCEVQVDGQPCYDYFGRFQVYTVGDTDNDNTTAAENEVKFELKSAMNSGEFDNAHPALLGVQYLDTIPEDPSARVETDKGDNVEKDTTPSSSIQSNGPNASVVIFSTVGAVLLVVAVTLIRRRQQQGRLRRRQEDISDFQMSQDDSGSVDSIA
jgi:hypothetical protein